ncbi:protein CLT2, chloroplastic-like [Rosa rugosa]|uniref:protein CLT2, chloroplastic-like n=1 Tax=Rosa rugosa TaxID=74645 RepID=UPI002B41380C|nr:protein CLT2, chloroplastic-like [Rosa rugosa]
MIMGSSTASFHKFLSLPSHTHTHTHTKNVATRNPLFSNSRPLLLLHQRWRHHRRRRHRLSLAALNAPFCLISDRGPRRNVRLHASVANPASSSNPSTSKRVVLSSLLTIALAVGNKVLYKLALVPMKNHPFFFAQFTTFGYVIIYFSILYLRYRSGRVTDEMIALPKAPFVAIGALDALGVAAGMAAVAMLPGPAIPLLSQTMLVWQLGFSSLILGKRYRCNQIVGCILVAVGVALAVASGSDSGQMLSGVEPVWPLLMIASSAFQAGAFIIKEFIFVDAAVHLKEKSLDILVVNSFGSAYQALFVLLFLPFLSNMRGIPFAQLPTYLKDGAGCFLNIGAGASGCNGAPLLPLLYVAANLLFNISLMNVVKISSAVVSSLVVMLSVPISIYVLSLPLPYLQEGATLSPFFLFGSAILVLGLILYSIPQPAKDGSKIN